MKGDRPVTGDHFNAVTACFWPIFAARHSPNRSVHSKLPNLTGRISGSPRMGHVDPMRPVVSVCFGAAYFAAAISASTAAGNPTGNGTPAAA